MTTPRKPVPVTDDRSGDPCPNGCYARLKVRTSRRLATGWQERHLHCPKCDWQSKYLQRVGELWRTIGYVSDTTTTLDS